MVPSQSRVRRGRVAIVNVGISAGLGYFVLGVSPEWVVLVLAAATLSLLLERVEAP